MGANAAQGNFVKNTVTGNQSITGFGFRPTWIIFYCTAQTGAGGNTDIHVSMDADGVTINWITNTGGADLVHFLAGDGQPPTLLPLLLSLDTRSSSGYKTRLMRQGLGS